MRLFYVFALLLTFTLPAYATPVSKDMANAYYQNCMAKQDPSFSQESQGFLCACTAAKMMDNLSIEDMQMMGRQDQSGRDALNKMIINVYAPCMEHPAREYHYNQCISNPQTAQLSGNPQALCGCMADQIAAHLRTNAQDVFTGILARNPNITDPMQALYDDPEFQQFARSKLLGCVR